MSAVNRFQVGVKKEVTWGTPVTPDRFFEFNSDQVKPMYGRVASRGMRAGTRVRRGDRQVPFIQGAGGTVEMDVLSKGFGFWLEHMLGGTVSTGAPADGKTTHTATIGDLIGKGFTYQSNHPFHPADTDQPFTYEGGKVKSWKISNQVGDALKLEMDLDFENVVTATALASASYPSGNVEPLIFAGGVVTIGGVATDVTECEVSCDNHLFGTSDSDDRRYIRGNAQHREPVEGDWREIAWSLGLDFQDLTAYNRFAASSAAGAVATIVLTWTGNILIGAASLPTLQLTVQQASFDEFDSTVDGPAPLQQKVSGAGLFDGSTSAVTLAYGTADATP